MSPIIHKLGVSPSQAAIIVVVVSHLNISVSPAPPKLGVAHDVLPPPPAVDHHGLLQAEEVVLGPASVLDVSLVLIVVVIVIFPTTATSSATAFSASVVFERPELVSYSLVSTAGSEIFIVLGAVEVAGELVGLVVVVNLLSLPGLDHHQLSGLVNLLDLCLLCPLLPEVRVINGDVGGGVTRLESCLGER